MELYHGSNQTVENPKFLTATHPMDFGGGFYTTINYRQAEAFAYRIAKLRGHTPVVNIYEFDETNISNYKILKFDEPNAKWLNFVISNRKMEYKDENYELVIGPVANDDVYETITALENGIYDEQEALKRLKIKKLFNQYVFKTQEIMNELIFKEYRNV
ncbi:MAG: DUF3990 domain-containing protein [Chitinivibrionia bacterium]|nr:DUF3990 domain-containing protein [Chitinivibrionia bacterium]